MKQKSKKMKVIVKEKKEHVLAKIFGELLGIVIGLFLLGQFEIWNIPFVTKDKFLWIPIAKQVVLATGIVNILKFGSKNLLWRNLMIMIVGILSVISIYNLVAIYPFDFSSIHGSMNILFRIILFFILFATIINTLASMIRTLRNLR